MGAEIIMVSLIARYGLLLALCFGNPLAAVGQHQPLFIEAVDYSAFEPIEGCTRDRKDAVYKGCLRPRELYDAALITAREMKRPLMIIWGFDECPACKHFKARYFGKYPAFTTSLMRRRALSLVQITAVNNSEATEQIPLLYIQVREPAGAALAEELGVTDIARARGWHRVWTPFITFSHHDTEEIVSQSIFSEGEFPCYYSDEFAMNLEQLNYLPQDTLFEREMCTRN